ncbi:cytochrome d ubiquinol oxidase subunit II [Pseudomarimonas salicorniae]|uniref:Cytochrome d ubiquinol oxidase subunit II n=1 Tax=Pseudomarimonas salicorniae TaxID=2933270 RepID=A0ABT0GM65_9GAMM|nr:cytochrome d ubiquinol oxidase subunit II [Lysobacter sp. CAU 1642]MCK7595642.1 cytochrome d ubiquinol oxidase subunit II [Lysobacter sp. CAU 1642]
MDVWLPLAFTVLMGLAMLAYVVLDGFDLGIGILLPNVDDAGKDRMIAAIGPFWDANETWLVLGIGLLLVAFPKAHGAILGALYLPVTVMLIGLILRGVAFDFRVKADDAHRPLWNGAFFAGSLMAALAQGWMLGSYVIGFRDDAAGLAFSALIAVCLAAGYVLLGACWLIMKSEGPLREQGIRWAWRALWLTGLGIAAVSVVTPLVSERIFAKWFSMPAFFFLLKLPLLSALVFFYAESRLRRLARRERASDWQPFASAVALFLLAFIGLAYSLFPYLVVDELTVWTAAASTDALLIMFVGAAITLPVIIGYTVFAYRVFWGRDGALSYE